MDAEPRLTMDGLCGTLALQGHQFVPALAMRALLAARGGIDDWAEFAQSWDGMPVDTYMADGGRYRRRRYAVYAAEPAGIVRAAHQAHFQSLDYNRLNGGVARWFAPIDDAVGNSRTLRTILGFCLALFNRLAPETRRWHIETHQFRIEALPGVVGQPTPEGRHRDGVDFVLVLMLRRCNIASGTTTIHAPDGGDLGAFTLTAPLDATLLDDRRVLHGVTPVEAIDAGEPAYRDVLVVTFRGDAAHTLTEPEPTASPGALLHP